jgi:hypothetical protein
MIARFVTQSHPSFELSQMKNTFWCFVVHFRRLAFYSLAGLAEMAAAD